MGEVIRNLLTVVQNPTNCPNARNRALLTLSAFHRGHPDVDAYFERLAQLEAEKKLRERILALKNRFAF